jgi:hypothetical protein
MHLTHHRKCDIILGSWLVIGELLRKPKSCIVVFRDSGSGGNTGV